MRHWVLLGLIVAGASADVMLAEQPYRFAVLNYPIEVPKDIMTFQEVLKLIENTTGYMVVNKVDEIPLDKRYIGLKRYKIIGDLLNKVLEGYDAIVDVDDKHRIIKIIYPEVIYIDLPYGWPVRETKKEFKRMFPYVKFYVEGNRITAYGLPQDIAKLAPIFARYQKNAYKKDIFKISIYPYCTKSTKPAFLARRKYYGSEEYGPIKSLIVKMGQDEKVALSYKDVNINITYDKADGIMEIGKYRVPVSKLSVVGLAFRIRDPENPSTIKGFIKDVFNKGITECNDAILTIDKYVPVLGE